ncbi:MAG: hypothetical protein IKU51_07220 [Clostridia bacterium]|nr:hypothetical protein [Clostridia bacterium]
MTIAEKLQTVAENEQRVYDAGYAKGQVEGSGGDVPDGFVKVDPTWTNFSQLCYARPSMIKHLKYEDTANGTSFLAMFSTITAAQTNEDVVIPRLDYRKGTNFTNMFIYSERIVEIGEMDISNATAVANMFNGCASLKKISFAQGCIKIAINFSSCPLLDDGSIQSIIDGLADLTRQTAQTLTLHATVKGALTDDQRAAIAAKNWVLA